MQEIIPTTSLVEQIVGRQKRTDAQSYRLMTYVVQQPVDDGVLLYNTLTCSLVLLTPRRHGAAGTDRTLVLSAAGTR